MKSNPKRVKMDLSANCQLPFVEYKHQDPKYSRKIKSTSLKNGQKYVINNNKYYCKTRSDRIKGQYIKICKQIKQNYSDQRNLQFPKDFALQQTEHQVPLIFGKIISATKNLTQPAQPSSANPLQIAPEEVEIRKNYLPGINASNRYNQDKMPNYYPRLKRFETDYLSIQKLKIGIRQIREKCLTPDKSVLKIDMSMNGIINEPKKQQLQQSIEKSSRIFSIRSETKHEEKQPDQRKQINSASTSVCSTQLRVFESNNKKITHSRSIHKQSTMIKKKFKPPYETYYYRDLLWKVNLSNQMIIETPLQYEHRLRVYIGKGNNSGLIRGLIKRRIWFAITDRIQDANFVWTQLKYLPYFQNEKKWKQNIGQIQYSLQKGSIPGLGLFTDKQAKQWEIYFKNYQKVQQRQDERLIHRTKYFTQKNNMKQIQQQPKETEQNTLLKIRTILKTVNQIRQQKMQNHFRNNYMIGNKKTLFKTMSVYYKNRDDYVFNYLPYTFHIQKGIEDESYFRFLKFYYQRGKQCRAKASNSNSKNKNEEECNAWIVKPGENSNRGYGIRVCKTLQQIKQIIKQNQKLADGSQRTYIIQAYLQKPLLYQKRKFDLRHYMMMTCVNGILKGYWYREGYVRTSAIQYNLSSKQSKIHLTNDAIQKKMAQYGKYEKGNKLSYQDLHIYLDRLYGYKNYNFKEIIIPKMKKITTDVIKACSGSIDTNFHGNNFQIFGLDFMIDSDFNVWLIQVNTNPCLEISCPLLGSIIPKMIQNALQLTLDCMYPPPVRYNPKGIHYTRNLSEQNNFDLVYDSRVDGINRESIDVIDEKLLEEEDEEFEDDGQEWDEDD